MGISRIIVRTIKKFRYRKFLISAYANEQPISHLTSSIGEIKIANKECLSNHILINAQLKNNTCYYVEVNNELAHFSWLFKNNLLAKQLKLSNYWTIGNCETYEKYRGNGLYGIVVSKMISDYPDQKFVLFIEPSNISSIKGVIKIGLKCIGTYKVTRFLGISLRIKKINV